MREFLYWEQGIKLLYTFSAVICIIGCSKVFLHFIKDSEETGRVAFKWFGTSFLLFTIAFILLVIYNSFLKRAKTYHVRLKRLAKTLPSFMVMMRHGH